MLAPLDFSKIVGVSPLLTTIFNSGFDVQIGSTTISTSGSTDFKYKYPFLFHGNTYYLDKVSFTAPGGHQINFVSSDLEISIQLLTKASLFNDQSQLNIAIPVQGISAVGNNVGNKDLYRVLVSAASVTSASTLNIPSLTLNTIFPTTLDYFYYQGSQITPPCGQTVDWVVLSTPIQVASSAIQGFRTSIIQNISSCKFF